MDTAVYQDIIMQFIALLVQKTQFYKELYMENSDTEEAQIPVFLKPATHYSSLFANNNKTTFSQKNWISRNVIKRGLHTIRHRTQFSQMCVASVNMVKKVHWIRQKTTYFGKRISWKSFSQNTHESDESLSVPYLHFAQILSVRSFFIIVHE